MNRFWFQSYALILFFPLHSKGTWIAVSTRSVFLSLIQKAVDTCWDSVDSRLTMAHFFGLRVRISRIKCAIKKELFCNLWQSTSYRHETFVWSENLDDFKEKPTENSAKKVCQKNIFMLLPVVKGVWFIMIPPLWSFLDYESAFLCNLLFKSWNIIAFII